MMPDLGKRATVFFDREGNDVATVSRENLGGDELISPQEVLELTQDISVVSTYSLHVALFALQNPTPENIAKALAKIGCSLDCDEHTDSDSLLPLPVGEPSSWERDY